MKRVLVTGSEGFLGTRLCARLEALDVPVTRWDVAINPDAMDLTRPMGLRFALGACDTVIHLAANADVRGGWADPTRDLAQNLGATSVLLESMRRVGVTRLLFASTSAVYGHGAWCATEDTPCRPTSLYGASKVACEALIGAYCEAGHLDAIILRFAPLLGPGYRHGIVTDLVARLTADPNHLELLGDGDTARGYVDVDDAVDAVLEVIERDKPYECFNVSHTETLTATDIAKEVSHLLGHAPEITTTGDSWPGDHPQLLDASRLRALGWKPRYSLTESIARSL